ncbi:response regulator [uncultured Methanospirillum sp.]|uniref:response regulator n=1 Tax=uncultured Methanospirillum sp. TaxID=262503 RepID=UPI003748113F
MKDDRLKVIYVDDEVPLLQLGKIFLERSGSITIDTVSSAKEALKMIPAGNYDAIISDYQMPGMDGIEFLQVIRETIGDIPFILFTGRGREEVVIQAINNGADFYLQKGGDPVPQFVELEHKIHQAAFRKKTEGLLCQSERTSRALLNATADAVALLDINLNILDANDVFSDRVSSKPLDVIGKNLSEFTSEDVYNTRKQKFDEVVQTKRAIRFEDSNNDLNLENNFYPIFNENGDIVRFAVFTRDITSSKRKESELSNAYEKIAQEEEELRNQFDLLAESEKLVKASEERLLMAQAIGHMGCWEFDRTKQTFWGSVEARKILGIPLDCEEISIADLEERIIENEFSKESFLNLIFNNTEYNITYKVNPLDGSPHKIVHSVGKVEKDSEGKITRVIGVIRDVTQEKLAEKNLIYVNNLLESLIKQAPYAILLIRGTPENITVIINNRFSSQMLGDPVYSGDPVDVNKPHVTLPRFFSTDGTKEIELKDMPGSRALLGEYVNREEYLIRLPNETEYIGEINAFPLFDENNLIIAGAVVAQDVTQRKRDEDVRDKMVEALSLSLALSKVGYWEYDLTEEILTWSDELFFYFGQDPLTYKPSIEGMRTLIQPDDLPGFNRMMQNTIDTGETESRNIRIIHPDTSIHTLKVVISAKKDDRGVVHRLFGTCLDIS